MSQEEEARANGKLSALPWHYVENSNIFGAPGLSKREFMATMIMAGVVSSLVGWTEDDGLRWKTAIAAVKTADDLLLALEQAG